MKSKESLLILGAGIYQVPLIKRAKSRGFKTIVVSIPGNYPGFEIADTVYYKNTTDKESILRIAEEEKVSAIVTTGTDVAVVSMGYVCSRLGLCGLSEEAGKKLTDKAVMKETFVRGGVSTSEFVKVTSYDEAEKAVEKLGVPVMLKIVDKSGSRGIVKINDKRELDRAYRYASKATNAPHMIVEKFVDGREIGIDAFVQNGKLLLMLPHEKYVYHSANTDIPIGHICPMQTSEKLYNNILRETEKIIECAGLDNCEINIDAFVLEDETVSIIEAAGRCGATGIPEVISGYTGRDYYDCILDNALGIEVEPFDLSQCRPTASLLLYSEKSGILDEVKYCFNGKTYRNENAREGFESVEISFSPGDEIDGFMNGTDRIGMAVFCADTTEQLRQKVESFRSALSVKVK